MEDLRQYMNVLGRKVRDVVTGLEGICSAVVFDLPGCIQCEVRQPGTDKDDKLKAAYSFDYNRLIVVDEDPVMPLPSFRKMETEPKYPKGNMPRDAERG